METPQCRTNKCTKELAEQRKGGYSAAFGLTAVPSHFSGPYAHRANGASPGSLTDPHRLSRYMSTRHRRETYHVPPRPHNVVQESPDGISCFCAAKVVALRSLRAVLPRVTLPCGTMVWFPRASKLSPDHTIRNALLCRRHDGT